jgi:hypothetical protein
VSEIDPQYAAQAARIVAVRQAEEAARVTRRRRQWGAGYRVNELMELPSDDVRVALNTNEQAAVAALVASGTPTVPTTAALPFADRRIKVGAVYLSDPRAAYACAISPTLKAAVEAAEAAHLESVGQT